MIIHAPHQFPPHIRYTIFCAKSPIAANTSPHTFIQRVKHKLARISARILPSKPPQQQIEDETWLASQLKTILTKFSPTSECLGFQQSKNKNINAHSIVLFSSNWRKIKRALLRRGWKAEKILIMPIPEGDFWAFWNNAHMFVTDSTGHVNAEKTVASPEFSQYLANHCVVVSTDDRMEYRRYTDSSTKGLERGHQLYPFPAFATDAIAANREKIQHVMDHLSDERSQQTYQAVLFGEPQERFAHYFQNTLSTLQYFEYVTIQPGHCIINAGVASGFEIPFFSAHLDNKGQVHCIDPDGFDHLSRYVRTFHDEYKHIFVEHRYVMCDRSAGKPPQPKLGDFSGYAPITIDDLAELQQLKRVDFIKMDVEAMESLALDKISNTIDKFRPQLAVAVYHEIEHFWELPLRIIAMCKEYNFYFNIYSPTHFEGIFYAIPKEK